MCLKFQNTWDLQNWLAITFLMDFFGHRIWSIWYQFFEICWDFIYDPQMAFYKCSKCAWEEIGILSKWRLPIDSKTRCNVIGDQLLPLTCPSLSKEDRPGSYFLLWLGVGCREEVTDKWCSAYISLSLLLVQYRAMGKISLDLRCIHCRMPHFL